MPERQQPQPQQMEGLASLINTVIIISTKIEEWQNKLSLPGDSEILERLQLQDPEEAKKYAMQKKVYKSTIDKA